MPRLEEILRDHGFEVLWSGEGTVDRSALGPRASETPPIFWQIACRSVEPGPEASHNCYRAMVAIERDLTCHVASFSANDAVYKVQGQPEVIPRFYPEMGEEDFASARIIAHNRYSTNTYPTFSRVQPFSILGHNGEINTIAQLREQSEQLGLPISRLGSDSQDLNRLLEGLIFEKGLSLLEAVEFALPPILGEVHRLPAKLQDLYVHYREALGPYAQGPVALACRAKDEMVFAVDAMGLRPLWWIETGDMYVVSSEPGIIPVSELTRDPAPLAPGEKVALVNDADGVPQVLDYWELQREVYARAKSRGALPNAETRALLAGGLEPVAVEEVPDDDLAEPELDLEILLASAGWIESDRQQLQFHADRGAEPIGSLGWDGPLGPFTPVPMPLSDYFQETVAVVTNPAIDREREVEHFSTRVVLGRRPPIEGVEPDPPQRCELRMPLILGGMRPGTTPLSLPEMRRVAVGQGVACMEDVLAAWDWRAATLPLHFPPRHRCRGPPDAPGGGGGRRRPDRRRAARAERHGRRAGRQGLRPAPRRRRGRQGAARGPQGRRLLVAPRRQPGAPGRRHPQRARRDGRPRLRRPGDLPLRDDGAGDERLPGALRGRHPRPRGPPEGHGEGPLDARHPRAARLRPPGARPSASRPRCSTSSRSRASAPPRAAAWTSPRSTRWPSRAARSAPARRARRR